MLSSTELFYHSHSYVIVYRAMLSSIAAVHIVEAKALQQQHYYKQLKPGGLFSSRAPIKWSLFSCIINHRSRVQLQPHVTGQWIWTLDTIKGSVSQDFRPQFFFQDSNPSGPLTNSLKYFRFLFRFSREIRSHSDLRGVHHTAKMISAVCIIPLWWSPRCASHCRDKLHTSGMKSKSSLVSGCF